MTRNRPSIAAAYGLIAPVQFLVGVLIIMPAIYVLWLSFQESSYGQAASFVGWANYLQVLADANFWHALLNTVGVVLVIVHVELLLGLGLALLFASGVPLRPLLLAIVLAPYAVSEVSAVVMWRFLFDPDVGLMTQILHWIGLPTLEWGFNPTDGLTLVCLLTIWLNLPFTFIILYSARLAIPVELYEAARVDGGTPWRQFIHVTLPLLMPAMLVAVLFRYIIAFRLFSEVWLLTGGGPARSTEVMGVYLYLEGFRYNEFGAASATGFLMVFASLALALVYLRLLQRRMFTADAR